LPGACDSGDAMQSRILLVERRREQLHAVCRWHVPIDARLDGFSVIRRTTDESVAEIGARAVANMQRFLAS
ncbi:MAG: hypothetical protein QF806_07330, partial [Pseudomonadales bacterium]|nr:hypothetical protein [Pseudomonadales bacterium]